MAIAPKNLMINRYWWKRTAVIQIIPIGDFPEARRDNLNCVGKVQAHDKVRVPCKNPKNQ
jgi:hypothetical protein